MREETTAPGEERPSASADSREDWRSFGDVDSDRILYSTEFRRLAGVTQVVPPQDDFVLHDRLTHSLKVAQIASSLAKSLTARAATDLGMSDTALAEFVRPEVCYAAGMAHDIGHPPFGHAAEVQLQKELGPGPKTAKGEKALPPTGRPELRDSFEGNAQSFRIVTRLSFRKPITSAASDGLDLTWRTLAAIAKYPWLKGDHPAEIDKLNDKWSIYDSEAPYLDELHDRGLVTETRVGGKVVSVTRSVEAEIMDWADDIAYAVHDIEDFFRSGRIPLDRVKHLFALESVVNQDFANESTNIELLELLRYSMSKLTKLAPEIPEIAEWKIPQMAPHVRDEAVLFFPSEPFDGTRRAHGELTIFGSRMINYLEQAASLERNGSGVKLKVSVEGRVVAEFLKSLTYYFLILDPSVETMQVGQKRVVGELYRDLLALARDVFEDDFSKPGSAKRVPVRLREYASKALGDAQQFSGDGDGIEAPDNSELLARAVADFICGLTDKQATLLHKKLTGNPSGGFSASWLSI